VLLSLKLSTGGVAGVKAPLLLLVVVVVVVVVVMLLTVQRHFEKKIYGREAG
jgi:hypothetical protein